MFKKLTLFFLTMPYALYGVLTSGTNAKSIGHKGIPAYKHQQLKKEAKKNNLSAQKLLQKKQSLAKKELCLLGLTNKFCSKKRFCAIELLLKSQVDPNMPNARELKISFNSLPIGNAALRGNAKLTDLLQNYGADPAVTFKLGKHLTQAMHCAARGRSVEKGMQGDYVNTIYVLFRRGANPNAGGNQSLPFTPLHILAMQKNISWARQKKIALALFAIDALPEKKSFQGKTVGCVAGQAKLYKLRAMVSRRMQELRRERKICNMIADALTQKDCASAFKAISNAQGKQQMVLPLKFMDAINRLYATPSDPHQDENCASSSTH